MISIELQFFVEEILNFFNRQVIELDCYWLGLDLDPFVPDRVEQGVTDRIVYGNALVRIKNEAPSKEVFCFGCQVLEHRLEVLPLFVAERLQVLNCFLVSDELVVLLLWRADYLEDLVSMLNSWAYSWSSLECGKSLIFL